MEFPRQPIPVYQDAMNLLRFISYTGASTFVLYGEGIQNPTKKTLILRLLQQVASMFVFLVFLVVSVLGIFQLIVVVWKMKNIGEIIPNVIWLSTFQLALGTQIFLYLRKSVLRQLFQQWQETYLLYADPSRPNKDNIQRIRPRMYFIYLGTVLTSLALVMVVVIDFPIVHFQYMTTPFLANNVFLTCFLYGLILLYAWNLTVASDLVPSIIYFNLSVALEKTSSFPSEPSHTHDYIRSGSNYKTGESESKCLSETPDETSARTNTNQIDRWRKDWLHYEAIRTLIREMNSQFGSILLLNHGAVFFVTSSAIFSILRWYRGLSWLLLLVNAVSAVATILRFVTTVLLSSRLHTASELLHTKICRYLALQWFNLKPCERQFFAAFSTRVQDGGTVASPLGLYPIRPSILLALLPLLVTYLIVLLQSSEVSSFAEYGNFTGRITGTRFFTLL